MLTNDLIIKWKKITKEAVKSKATEAASIDESANKPTIANFANSQELKEESLIKIECNQVKNLKIIN